MESTSTKNHLSQQALVISHIKRLRNNRFLKNVPIIFIPEIGTGFQHTQLSQAVSTENNCHIFHEKNGPIPGIHRYEEE